jgi:N-acyl-D-amino-acid deacylase
MPEYDILIKNGSIVDGTGVAAYEGAVAIKGDRIVSVLSGKDASCDAVNVFDASGLSVTPGFIDVHNHGDLSILYYPEAEGFVRQGITTFVASNCGTSPGPYGEYIGQPLPSTGTWFQYDIYSELAPYTFYPEVMIKRNVFNERHEEIHGWVVDWHTMGGFFKRVEKEGLSPNYVPLVGHSSIRTLEMGPDSKRKATRPEIEAMTVQVRSAMEDGCRGLSVGRDYEPAVYADLEELVACAKAASDYGGIYACHCLTTGLRKARGKGETCQSRAQRATLGRLEAIEIGRRCNIPVQISHMWWSCGSDAKTEDEARECLDLIDGARKDGVDVSFDVCPPRPGLFTSPWLVGLLLPWLKMSGSPESFAKAVEMRDFRDEIKSTVLSGKWYRLNPNISPDWAASFRIISCKNECFINKTLSQVAESLGMESLDALMEVLAADPYTKVEYESASNSCKLLFYSHPEAMFGVDTFALDDKWECRRPPWYLPNENSFGGFPHYFRYVVRETKTLNFEEAVRKVTSLPAKKFKIKDRGVLRPGYFADVVIIDADRIAEKGTQLTPRQYPDGVEHVIINGVPVVSNNRHNGERPGKILYRE